MADQWNEDDQDIIKDVRLEMKIKNNVLWKEIHKRARSVRVFCNSCGLSHSNYTSLCGLLSFRASPFRKKNREYRAICRLLEKVLGLPAEYLFPEELYSQFVGTETSKAVEISSFAALPAPERQKLLFLPAPDDTNHQINLEDLRKRIRDVFYLLTPREREVISLRYGLDDGQERSCPEVAKILKIARSNVWQKEQSALCKFRGRFAWPIPREFEDFY